jgi:hypothetical protein
MWHNLKPPHGNSSCFNQIIEKKIYFKKSKWCHMSHSWAPMCEQTIGLHCNRKCSCKCNRMNSSLNTCIKSSYLYYTKNIFHLSFVISVVGNLSFVVKLIFVCKCDLQLKSSYKRWFFYNVLIFYEIIKFYMYDKILNIF